MRVVVLGGGIVGLATAWRCRQAGWTVTVVDPDPGGGASHAAAGMLAPASEATYGEEALTALNRAALTRWPAFADDLEAATGARLPLHRGGCLCVGFDDDDRRHLDEVHRYQVSIGLEPERLGSRGCRELEPMLSPRVRGGVHLADEANVDPRAACRALLVALEQADVRIERHRGDGLVVRGRRAVALRLASGDVVDADRVVVATGAWAADLGGVPPSALPPIRPVKGQVLRLQAERTTPPLARTVRALVHGEAVYLVPRDTGELVVGATVEEQGFDTSVTAGAVHRLLDAAVTVVPAVAELCLVEATARPRPATPDGGPVIGATDVDGLVLATGHHRNGVLQAPLTAEAVVRILAGAQPPAPVLPFDIGRFAS